MKNADEVTLQFDDSSRVAAVAVVAELTLKLQADIRDRNLSGHVLYIGTETARIARPYQPVPKNLVAIPMPSFARVHHLLDALMIEDSDVTLGALLIAKRLFEIELQGGRVDMYSDEKLGRPAAALHIAIRRAVG